MGSILLPTLEELKRACENRPTCNDCVYFQQKWKSEHSDWSYCDYWYRDTCEGSPCCDKFQKKLSKVESNGKN